VYLRVVLCAVGAAFTLQTSPHTTGVTWQDVAPFHARLAASGLTAASFDAYVDRVRQENAVRVREGDLDHLIFYTLQSTRFTRRPPIEPALSAKALMENDGRIPAEVRGRIDDLLKAIDSSSSDARLTYFRALVRTSLPKGAERDVALVDEYRRVMKFVYNKEFVAQRNGPAAVADLYRARGRSTDTAG